MKEMHDKPSPLHFRQISAVKKLFCWNAKTDRRVENDSTVLLRSGLAVCMSCTVFMSICEKQKAGHTHKGTPFATA